MIVRCSTPTWRIYKRNGSLFWALNLEGPEGDFWRYTPFVVKGAIGTVKRNLAELLTEAKQGGCFLTEGLLPTSAFAPLSGILSRVENLDQFYLWGVKISFIDCNNLAMFVGENDLKIMVPWE